MTIYSTQIRIRPERTYYFDTENTGLRCDNGIPITKIEDSEFIDDRYVNFYHSEYMIDGHYIHDPHVIESTLNGVDILIVVTGRHRILGAMKGEVEYMNMKLGTDTSFDNLLKLRRADMIARSVGVGELGGQYALGIEEAGYSIEQVARNYGKTPGTIRKTLKAHYAKKDFRNFSNEIQNVFKKGIATFTQAVARGWLLNELVSVANFAITIDGQLVTNEDLRRARCWQTSELTRTERYKRLIKDKLEGNNVYTKSYLRFQPNEENDYQVALWKEIMANAQEAGVNPNDFIWNLLKKGGHANV